MSRLRLGTTLAVSTANRAEPWIALTDLALEEIDPARRGLRTRAEPLVRVRKRLV